MRGERWLFSLLLLVLVTVAGARDAQAQRCSVSTTSVAFGSYDVFSSTPLASTGSITYYCWGGVFAQVNVTIWLSKGLHSSTNNPRQMASGTQRLSYNLYRDSQHSQIWGDPSPNQYSRFNVPKWTNVTVNVYGLIPAGQDVAAGSYADSVTVTINY